MKNKLNYYKHQYLLYKIRQNIIGVFISFLKLDSNKISC